MASKMQLAMIWISFLLLAIVLMSQNANAVRGALFRSGRSSYLPARQSNDELRHFVKDLLHDELERPNAASVEEVPSLPDAMHLQSGLRSVFYRL